MSVTITPTEMSVDTPVTVDGAVTADAFVGDGAGLTGVELTAQKDQPNGYAGLDANGGLTAPHVQPVASIAALKTTPGAAGRTVAVAGYYAAGDGGGGTFWWDVAATDAPDDAIVVQVTGTATGRWRRQCDMMCFNVLWFGAKGDGTTDDTATIQKALDAARGPWDSVNNRPQRWYDAVVQGTGPQGSRVYLPGGPPSDQPFRTYKTTAPLKVWPHTELYGDGTTTMVNAQAIPVDRAAFEFQYVDIGGWWHNASYFHDFKIMSGGHGFASDPSVVATFHDGWDNVGIGYCRFHRINFTGRGWGIWLPGLSPGWTKGQYSQEVEVDDFLHQNPVRGGIAISGNLNFIRRYAVINGFGGWDGAQGFVSPWVNQGRGQIDIGGQGNTVEGCHVEHGLPDYEADPVTHARKVLPENQIVMFRFHNGAGTSDSADVIVRGNWPENHQDGGYKWCYFFDRTRPALGSVWNYPGVNTNFVGSGTVILPDMWAAMTSPFLTTDAKTRLRVGYAEDAWAADLPLNGDNRWTDRVRMGSGGGYAGGYSILPGGGVTYDPNPSGADLPFTVGEYYDAGTNTVGSYTLSNGTYTVNITATTRTDGRGAGGLMITAGAGVDVPWALMTFEVASPTNAFYLSYWGANSSYPPGPDALVRTQNGKVSLPLIGWKTGAVVYLQANKVAQFTISNLRITPCVVF